MFTLIIPYHNRECFLPRTLHSLLQSTVQPSQIILVDNASTDASRQVCEQFACEHPDCPIQLIAESKPGACHARNKALQMVTEEWVYFFDSDDELSPDYFQAVSRQVQQHPSADMIACATVRVYPDGRRAPREVQYSADPVDQILSGQLVTQGMFLKTAFLQRIGGWNGQLPRWNDCELGLRALLHNPRGVWLKDKPYHSVYEHAESITGTDFSSSAQALLTALQTAASEVGTQSRCLFALACRSYILAGNFARENSIESANQARQQGNAMLNKLSGRWKHIFGRILYHYVRLGGRGAWRIALHVVRQTSSQ